MARAHRQAAAYWQWRVEVWPQDEDADLHDLLEARHHLLQAGDLEEAAQVTEVICVQLQTRGAWDQETSLILEILAWLPAGSRRRSAWIGQLGNIAHMRGDHAAAASRYQRAIGIFERLGDQAGMATSYHSLGLLAHSQGDHEEAARQYQRSLDIFERLGDQAAWPPVTTARHPGPGPGRLRGGRPPVPASIGNFERLGDQAGMAAAMSSSASWPKPGGLRGGGPPVPASLDINERLGDQAGMATSYHNLGILAQDQGDYEEAARQYQRSLDINEQLGNQAGMAGGYASSASWPRTRGITRRQAASTSAPSASSSGSATRRHGRGYHKLGVLAQGRGITRRRPASTSAPSASERLGDRVGMATSYRHHGILEKERGGQIASGNRVARQGARDLDRLVEVAQGNVDLRRLGEFRRELGTGQFTSLLNDASGYPDLADAITSLLDQLDENEARHRLSQAHTPPPASAPGAWSASPPSEPLLYI